MRRRRGEDGQASLELIGAVPLLAIAALAVAQVLLFGHTAIVTEQAARTAARVAMVESSGDAVRAAARSSLPDWLRADARTRFPRGDRHRVEVSTRVPTVIPGVTFRGFRIERTVEMPRLER